MPPSLHQRVIDRLGAQIVTGALPAGSIRLAERLEAEFGVSRSVIREALRVLQTLGLVEPVKRVGFRVLPRDRWEVYDPRVIRWRLKSSDEGRQLRSLTELRCAVEPMAAELAARHAREEDSRELMSLAAGMRTLGRGGDLMQFLELDTRFHQLLMTASGNEMLAKLGEVVAAVLRGRTELGLMPDRPDEEALQMHVDVADAVQGGHPDRARAAMERIVRLAGEELESLWADEARAY